MGCAPTLRLTRPIGRLLFLVLLLLLPLCAPAGLIQTRDGQRHDGEVTFQSPDALLVRSADGATATVPLASVQRAVFAPATQPTASTQPAPSTASSDLPSGWNSQDIGPVKSTGAASFDPKTNQFTVRGSGCGVWGYEDACHFAYLVLEGDGQLIARVAKVENPDGRAMAMLNFRESLAPDARQASLTLHPVQIHFNVRPNPPAGQGWSGEPLPKDEPWLRLTRKGDVFSGYKSKDGRYWQLLDQRQIKDLPARLYAGLAASAFVNIGLGSAVFERVQIVPGTPQETYFPDWTGPDRGVILTSGSRLPGEIRAIKDGQVILEVDKQPKPLPLERIAWAYFAPLPPDLDDLAARHPSGVLLKDGQFFDGEPTRLENNQLLVNSVLFGQKAFSASESTLAILFRRPDPANAAYELHLRDGSVLRVRSLHIGADTMTADEPVLGQQTLPLESLVEIRAVE